VAKQTGHSMAICNQYYARLDIQSRADEATKRTYGKCGQKREYHFSNNWSHRVVRKFVPKTERTREHTRTPEKPVKTSVKLFPKGCSVAKVSGTPVSGTNDFSFHWLCQS
jgi:hypothetical protein